MTENQQQTPGATRKPVKRRTVLRYGLWGAVGTGLLSFGGGVIGYLWPNLAGGFGADINVGNAQDIAKGIAENKAPFVYPAGRLYVVAWDPSLPDAMKTYGDDHPKLSDNLGLMALYQKCVHLGCRVPWCQTSQWFECPCHGSKYNRYGEWMDGPAPRGLDRFPSQINSDGDLVISTGTIITGPPRTVHIIQQEAEGPHCVSL